MGAEYSNDIFYSFGITSNKAKVSNLNYHLAFSNMVSQDDRFYTVWINPLKAKVFVNPTQNKTAWNYFDKSGSDNWRQLHNEDTSWGKGGFAVGKESHPRYAWAEYKGNGDLRGDSLYLIKLYNDTSQAFDIEYKLWLFQRLSDNGNRTWTFKLGTTDNTWDTTIVLNDLVNSKGNFMYFDLESGKEVVREPETASWDVVFTRYNTFTQGLDYTVTGLLSNYGVSTSSIAGNIMDNTIVDSFNLVSYSHYINSIGFDWKHFNMSTFKYELEENKVRLIKIDKPDGTSDYYALQFLEFGGRSDGKIVFDYAYLGNFSSINFTSTNRTELLVYPNPTQQILTIENKQPIASLSIYTIDGQQVLNVAQSGSEIDLTNLTAGNYFVQAIFDDGTIQQTRITKN